MGSTTHIEIISRHRSRSPSLHSHDEHEDELHENGVQVSPAEASPSFSVIHPQSQSGSSSQPGDFVHLHYPHEQPEKADGHPEESAARLASRERDLRPSRSGSVRRTESHHQPPPRDPGGGRTRRDLPSPTESGDSTEEYLRQPHHPADMHRSNQYYTPNGYPHSNSSGGSQYPSPYPHGGQMVPAQPQPAPHPYPQHYQPMPGPPAPVGYPHTQISHQAPYPPYAGPPSHVSSPYTSPYGHPGMAPYPGPTSGYFPPQYGYPPQQYAPQYMPPYPPPQIMPPYVDHYRVQSPGQAQNSVAEPAKEKLDDEAIIKRFEAMWREKEVAKKKEPTKEPEYTKEQAMRDAAAQVRAEAAKASAKSDEEARIREEARKEAIAAYEEKQRQVAEQVKREQQIRKEAAEAALKIAEAEAAAKAERAASEKKIAADAAAEAKTTAEKKAAEAATKVKEAAEKAQEEADKKLKEATEAAEKAKADAKAAEKKAAEATAPEKKKPVRFKDAIGRSYNFPYERCCKWRDMEGLINQAFVHIDNLADPVHDGAYDLLGPEGEVIVKNLWEIVIEPGMQIEMMMWPIKEPERDTEIIIGDDDGAINVDDILNPGKGRKRKKRPTSRGPGAFGMWMLGGAGGRKGQLKGDKKPDVAAGNQRDAESSCIAM